MMQHKLHCLRLRQAKVTVDLLELQEAGFNTRLELAVQQWKESLAKSPLSSDYPLASPPFLSASSGSPSYSYSSLFQVMLPPSQTYRLPRNAVPRYAGASMSHNFQEAVNV
jgi:hypothetical protein